MLIPHSSQTEKVKEMYMEDIEGEIEAENFSSH